MPNYIFAYHGGTRPESEEEGQRIMAQWNAWYSDMGSAVVEGGGPVGMSKTVAQSGTRDEGGANPISGYSVISAASIEDACKMAQDCPMVLDGSGSVEIAEIVEM